MLYALLTVFLAPIAVWETRAAQRAADAEAASQQHEANIEAQERAALLRRVRKEWIAPLLELPLRELAWIELGLVDDSTSVKPALDRFVQRPDRLAWKAVPGKIRDVLQSRGPSLLVLGAPGSGKTTVLLQLAAELLDEAEHDVII
jgi:predicted NACHT family NTPase